MKQAEYSGAANVAIEEPAEDSEWNLGLALIELLAVFAIRKRLIAMAAGIGLLAGVCANLLLPTKYTATTRIMTPQQTQSAAIMLMNQLTNSATGLLSSSAASSLGLRNPNDIYIGVLGSRTVADGIITDFDLKNVYHARDVAAARKKLAEATSILSEKSGMIAVSVTDRDRARSAQLANAYTERLRTLTKTLAVIDASQRRVYYEDQLKHAKDDLIAAELRFRQVQQGKGVIQPEAQGRAIIGELADLRARIAAKQVELQAQRSFFTEHNPKVEVLKSELDTMRGEEERLARTNSEPGGPAMGFQDIGGASVDYLSAAHDVQYRQTLLDLLIRQYDAARLDESKDPSIIQVVDTAIPPERRSSPRWLLNIGVFMALSVLAAFTYLYFAEISRRNPRVGAAFTAFKTGLFSR